MSAMFLLNPLVYILALLFLIDGFHQPHEDDMCGGMDPHIQLKQIEAIAEGNSNI